MNDIGQVIYVPPGHAYYIFPVPAVQKNETKEATITRVLDSWSAYRAAAAHVIDTLDEGEDG